VPRRALLDALRALSDMLASADAIVVNHAPNAAHQLPRVEGCAEVDRLSPAARLPPDPKARSEIRPLQGELAEAKVQIDAGRQKRALDRLQQIQDRIDATHHGPLRVSWTLRVAQAQSGSDTKAAAQRYEEAFVLADSYRLDEQRVESAIWRGAIDADGAGRQDQARQWLRLASGGLERLGGDPRLEGYVDYWEGWLANRGDVPTHRFERALQRLQAAGVDDPLLRALCQNGRANDLGVSGRASEAIPIQRLAIDEAVQAHGNGGFTVAAFIGNLAHYQLLAGYPDDALASAALARAILDESATRGDTASQSNSRVWAEQMTGRVLIRLDRGQDAAEHLARARATSSSALVSARAAGSST
jgi:hypothetical protein